MLKSMIFRIVPKNIRLKMSSDTKRKRTTKTSNKSAANESNKENELSPYFNTNKRKMNQDGNEKKSGLKSSSSDVNEKRKPAEKMSSKIAEIEDESPSELKNKIKWQPENWLEQLNRIKTMRSQWDAPVDTMGCDSNFDANSPPNVQRLNILISLMLSSQTKDEITAKAMLELKKLPLEIDAILAADQEKIAQAIYPVSFYKRKAEYIQKTCKILKEQYNSDIPDTVDALCKLPGVGPKKAYLAMSCAWHKTVGIGVDTHVHRISNRLGWIRNAPSKTPEQTRKELEDWLPQCHWDEVNHLLVGFGQTICRPVGPKCSTCLCNDICPTGKKETKHSNKATKKIELTD